MKHKHLSAEFLDKSSYATMHKIKIKTLTHESFESIEWR